MATKTFSRQVCDVCGRAVASGETEGWTHVQFMMMVYPIVSQAPYNPNFIAGLNPHPHSQADLCSPACFDRWILEALQRLRSAPGAPERVALEPPLPY